MKTVPGTFGSNAATENIIGEGIMLNSRTEVTAVNNDTIITVRRVSVCAQ